MHCQCMMHDAVMFKPAAPACHVVLIVVLGRLLHTVAWQAYGRLTMRDSCVWQAGTKVLWWCICRLHPSSNPRAAVLRGQGVLSRGHRVRLQALPLASLHEVPRQQAAPLRANRSDIQSPAQLQRLCNRSDPHQHRCCGSLQLSCWSKLPCDMRGERWLGIQLQGCCICSV
jgi:hypothetical protein